MRRQEIRWNPNRVRLGRSVLIKCIPDRHSLLELLNQVRIRPRKRVPALLFSTSTACSLYCELLRRWDKHEIREFRPAEDEIRSGLAPARRNLSIKQLLEGCLSVLLLRLFSKAASTEPFSLDFVIGAVDRVEHGTKRVHLGREVIAGFVIGRNADCSNVGCEGPLGILRVDILDALGD